MCMCEVSNSLKLLQDKYDQLLEKQTELELTLAKVQENIRFLLDRKY